MAPDRGALARPAAHADWYRLTANHITAKGGPTDTLINPGWGLFVGHRWIPHPAISGTTSATGGDSLMAIDNTRKDLLGFSFLKLECPFVEANQDGHRVIAAPDDWPTGAALFILRWRHVHEVAWNGTKRPPL